jgi:hypothetical protein
MQIGDTAPDFEAETTEGPIRFHDWIGDSWAVRYHCPEPDTSNQQLPPQIPKFSRNPRPRTAGSGGLRHTHHPSLIACIPAGSGTTTM